MPETRTRQFYEEENMRGEVIQKLNNMRNAESEYNAELYKQCLVKNDNRNYCDERQEERFKNDARKIIKEENEDFEKRDN